MRKIILIVLGILAAGFILIQLVPYGRNHNNPPVAAEPEWDSPETKALAVRACYDCHSNETVWPWYSNVAPISWLVQRDVEEGRETLNFSEWGTRRHGEESEEMAEVTQRGQMPLPYYLITHPEARLNDVERQQLVRSLQTIGGGEGAFAGGESGEHEDGEYEDDD